MEQALRKSIQDWELQGAEDFIVSRAVPCIRFADDGDGEDLPLGATRFGGDPDLPHGMGWPAAVDPPDDAGPNAIFLAQLNLAELPVVPGWSLPDDGLASFFILRFPGAEYGIVDVQIHSSRPDDLERIATPAEETLCVDYLERFHARRVRAEVGLSLPSASTAFRKQVERLCPDADANDMVNEALMDLACFTGPRKWFAQLGGFAVGSVLREDGHWTLAHRRLGLGREWWTKYDEATTNKIAEEAALWQLLLRVNSNNGMNANFSDAEYFFSFIKKAALEQRDFSDVPATIYSS